MDTYNETTLAQLKYTEFTKNIRYFLYIEKYNLFLQITTSTLQLY